MHRSTELVHRPFAGIRRRASALFVGVALLVPVLALASTGSVAAAADPNGISFTLEGCNLDHGATFDQSTITCSDSGYTTGDLGKSWAELDLVPHRVTLVSGANDPTQTYTFIVAGDYKNTAGTATGWDVISDLKLNTALSSASCPTTPTMGPQTITPSGGGVGGADQTIYRTVTLTQLTNTTCVYDYYQRLALGAHLFSGSSLQSNLWNQSLGSAGIGQKRLSIPVAEIAPQELSKTMSAVQNADHVWTLEKTPSPASINFGNTCASGAALTQAVHVTLEWHRLPATLGAITVVTDVYATNPAHRDLTVNVTDVIRSGTTTLDTASSGSVLVPANTTDVLVLHHVATVPSGTTNLNDIATATYTDVVTGFPIPGSVTATASASVQTGTVSNATASISDSESITGSGLDFSVAAPSLGSFSGYTAGTFTVGPVVWNSGSQSGDSSITFDKTIRVTSATSTSGTLDDTATLTGSDGFSATASASIDISADRSVSIKIDKIIPNVLSGTETASFTFDVKTGGAGGTTVETVVFNFSAGQTSKSQTVTGLDAGTAYTIVERADPNGKWATQPSQTVTVNPTPGSVASCTTTVTFTNGFAPATARVQKVTVPAGSAAGWQFTLTGPGVLPADQPLTTTGAGYQTFATPLAEGSYTITETPKDGWDGVATGQCSFTVDYPADAGRVFSCTFTNTLRGHVTVHKTENLGIPSIGYTFTLTGGPAPGVNLSLTTNTTNQGTLDFGSLKPGSYTLCELAVPAGTHSTLQDQGGVLNTNTGNVCLDFTLTAGQDKTFTIDNSHPLGGQRTIGYWKNWNLCANSKADRLALSQQTGNHLLEEFLNQSLGGYLVDTCVKAVAVLSSPSAKYAENQLAAQLLAAKLNIAAGASTCTSVNTAIAHADSLLSGIGYTGPGSTTVAAGNPKRADFLATASLLDQYNNGLIC
jgi:hypothetical protein